MVYFSVSSVGVCKGHAVLLRQKMPFGSHVIQIGVLVNLVTRDGIIKKICWRIALKHESEWKKTACILCCIVAV